MKNRPFCIAVCDDNPIDQQEIAEMAEAICKENQIYAKVFSFENAESLLWEMEESKQFDLLLIDVMMPGMDGMELARILQKQKDRAFLVFISSNREMALQGYEVAAVRYLAKPLDKEKMQEAICFCYSQSAKNGEIYVPVNGDIWKVAPQDIHYIEIVKRKCRIVQEGKQLDTSISISKLEEELAGEGFVRCHKSFLVNCRYVRSLSTSLMEMTDGKSIPISKHRIKEVRQQFLDYIKN